MVRIISAGCRRITSSHHGPWRHGNITDTSCLGHPGVSGRSIVSKDRKIHRVNLPAGSLYLFLNLSLTRLYPNCMPNSRKSSSNSDRIFYCHHPKHAPCVRSARQRAQHSIGQRETLYMRRAPELWWTPLAAALPYVAFMAPCPSVAFVASMPLAITNGFVQRAFSCGFRNATRHHRLSSNLSRSSRQLSTASRCQRTRILQRAATSSSSQGSRTPASRGPRASSGVERKGDRATSSSTSGKRRAPGSRRPSAYVPSDYRGVVGGSRGKWKARIVSKGGLRQLGTFG